MQIAPPLSEQQYGHVLVDARPLNGSHNGVARFVEQMIREWPNVSQAKVTLVSNRPIVTTQPLPAEIGVYVDHTLWRRIPGSIWLNLRAGAITKRLQGTHFLGTQHVLPLLGVKKIRRSVIVHDLVFRKFPQTMQWSNRVLSTLLVPRSITTADSIFCVSDTTRHDLLAEFAIQKDHVQVAYPGGTFDTTDTPKDIQTNAVIKLLVVGSIEPRKNLAKLLHSYLLLLKTKNVSVELDIVSGGGWGDALSMELRTSIETEPRIRIHRKVDDECLRSLYRNANFLVFPSIYEGFGLPMLEAVGKCAVIANDIPVFREIAAHLEGVRFVDFGSTDETVAQELTQSLSPMPAARFRNKEDFELFSWHRCAQIISTEMKL